MRVRALFSAARIDLKRFLQSPRATATSPHSVDDGLHCCTHRALPTDRVLSSFHETNLVAVTFPACVRVPVRVALRYWFFVCASPNLLLLRCPLFFLKIQPERFVSWLGIDSGAASSDGVKWVGAEMMVKTVSGDRAPVARSNTGKAQTRATSPPPFLPQDMEGLRLETWLLEVCYEFISRVYFPLSRGQEGRNKGAQNWGRDFWRQYFSVWGKMCLFRMTY